MEKQEVSQFMYDMLTTQPICWDVFERELVIKEIPDYETAENSSERIIKAQKIVSEHRKSVLKINKTLL